MEMEESEKRSNVITDFPSLDTKKYIFGHVGKKLTAGHLTKSWDLFINDFEGVIDCLFEDGFIPDYKKRMAFAKTMTYFHQTALQFNLMWKEWMKMSDKDIICEFPLPMEEGRLQFFNTMLGEIKDEEDSKVGGNKETVITEAEMTPTVEDVHCCSKDLEFEKDCSPSEKPALPSNGNAFDGDNSDSLASVDSHILPENEKIKESEGKVDQFQDLLPKKAPADEEKKTNNIFERQKETLSNGTQHLTSPGFSPTLLTPGTSRIANSSVRVIPTTTMKNQMKSLSVSAPRKKKKKNEDDELMIDEEPESSAEPGDFSHSPNKADDSPQKKKNKKEESTENISDEELDNDSAEESGDSTYYPYKAAVSFPKKKKKKKEEEDVEYVSDDEPEYESAEEPGDYSYRPKGGRKRKNKKKLKK